MSFLRWSIVVLILLLGAFARGFYIAQHSFWIDEGFSFYFALSSDLAATLASDVHPPLYFAALRLWSELTGHSELALRWFSFLPSVCSLALVYQVAKELARARPAAWGRRALPILAMLMLALADAESYLAQEARHYTWLTLLALCGMLFLVRWLRRARRGDWVAWLVASALMLYTHYVAAFALAAQALYCLIWLRGKRRWQALLVPLVSAVTLAPWLLAVGGRQLGNRDSYKVWSLDLSAATLEDIAVKYLTGQWALVIGLLALGCVSLIYRRQSSAILRFDRLTPLILLWLIAPFGLTVAVNEFLPFLEPRRLILCAPPIALLVACGLVNIRQPTRALLIVALVVYGVAQFEWHRGQPDWRKIARLTARYAIPGDLILTDVSSGDYPLRYYLLRERAGVRALEPGVRYEALQFQREYHPDTYEAWLPALLAPQKTVWLMYWSSDESAFNWLDELGFARSADFVHRHDGGAHGETLMHVFRYDRVLESEPAARFANGMFLQDFSFDIGDLRVDAIWGTSQPLARDYILSAKLLDEAGMVAAQHDGTPQLGQRETSGWRVGEFVYSPHRMTANRPLAAGRYQLIAQVYSFEDDGIVNARAAENTEYALLDEIEIRVKPG